jgi:2-C-methyl-D-erythritol 4-phosphate cytidylyltransferase
LEPDPLPALDSFSAEDSSDKLPVWDAILLGGGSGERFKGASSEGLPKQFYKIGAWPVFMHALHGFLKMECFRQIVLVMPQDHIEAAQDWVQATTPHHGRTLVRVVRGGDRRQDSSRLGLEAVEELSPAPSRVVIHDACRPVLSAEFLERVRTCLSDASYPAWVPVVPVVETLKRVEENRVVETVDRSLLQRVQTPQVFDFPTIRELSERSKGDETLSFTDDASLGEYYGLTVGVFPGDVTNIKLTYPFELETVQALLVVAAKNVSEVPCAPELVTTSIV